MDGWTAGVTVCTHVAVHTMNETQQDLCMIGHICCTRLAAYAALHEDLEDQKQIKFGCSSLRHAVNSQEQEVVQLEKGCAYWATLYPSLETCTIRGPVNTRRISRLPPGK